MDRVSSRTTGWLALAIGVTSFIGVVLLFIFLTGYFSHQPELDKFGNYSDVVGIVPPILSAILATTLHFAQRSLPSKASLLFMISVWFGVSLVTYGGWLIVTGAGGLVMQGTYHSLGYALIGLWVLALNLVAKDNDLLPTRLSQLGLVSGVFMLVGLGGLYGIVRGIDGNEPTVYLISTGGLSFVGHGIIYPIWCFWLGGWFLANNRKDVKSPS
jgi:hypothetical protein